MILCFKLLLTSLSKIEDSSYSVVQVPLFVACFMPLTTQEWKPVVCLCVSRVSDRPGIEPRVRFRLPRKEVIQPHLPVRLPCYDFTPITDPTLDVCPLAVSPTASGVADFRGVTGGVYKTRERIHRDVLTHGY